VRASLATDGRILCCSSFLLLTGRNLRTSLTYGHPYMIDVRDCDARLPSSGDSNDLYMDELVRLSVILGRVLKTIYRYVHLRTFSVGVLCLTPS